MNVASLPVTEKETEGMKFRINAKSRPEGHGWTKGELSENSSEEAPWRDAKGELNENGNAGDRQSPLLSSKTNPVYMTVGDRAFESGMQNFTDFRVIPAEDVIPNPTDDSANVYMLPESSEVTSDSGLETPDESSEAEMPKQHSIFTIFSIWNTMMGTSILAMPWALTQAGFGLGLFLILFVAGIACYMAYLANKTTDDLKIIRNLPKRTYFDISDAVEFHFGKAGRIISLVFSQIAMIGASIVYYVLLTNFLYNTGVYIYSMLSIKRGVGSMSQFVRDYDSSTGQLPEPSTVVGKYKNYTDIICVGTDVNIVGAGVTGSELFRKIWSQNRTVPAWLLIIVFPLISIKSPTILGKFTSLATLSVIYLFILMGIKGYSWGVNMDDDTLLQPVPQSREFFFSLTGTCSLAFFIHNALQTILRAQRHPENNARDITIAFSFATATYVLVGLIFFIIFPVSKYCIADNLLNNLQTDIPVFVGRLFLLLQMVTVYPMLVYLIRAQLMHAIFRNIYPSWRHVFVLHILLVGVGMLFAMVYPSIGNIIRFIGALCGLVFIFTIPPVITLLNKRMLSRVPIEDPFRGDQLQQKPSFAQQTEGDLLEESRSIDDRSVAKEWVDSRTKKTWIALCVIFSFIVLLGLINFIGQFIVLGL